MKEDSERGSQFPNDVPWVSAISVICKLRYKETNFNFPATERMKNLDSFVIQVTNAMRQNIFFGSVHRLVSCFICLYGREGKKQRATK